MARNDQVTAKFRLDGQQAKSDVASLQASFKSSFTEINSGVQLAKTTFQAFEAAIGKVSSTVERWVDLASKQEKLEQRLTTAVQLRESFSRQQLDTLNKLNTALERKTGIDDKAFLQLQGSLAEIGIAPKHFESASKAAAAFADITGTDVQGSLKVIAKIFSGEVPVALKRFGVSATDAQGALDFLLDRFPVVEEHSKTFAGGIDKLKNAFEDWEESLGKAIIQNKDVRQLISDVTDKVNELTGSVDDGRPKIDQFISGVVKGLRDIGSTLQEHAGDFKILLELLIALKALEGATSLAGTLGSVAKGIGGLVGGVSGAAGTAAAGASVVGGGSALLGALATGGAVIATGGMLLALPSTDAKTLADRIRESIPRKPGYTTEPTPYGPSLPPGFVQPQVLDFEAGTGVSVSKADIEKRRADAKKKREMWKAIMAGADPLDYASKAAQGAVKAGEPLAKEDEQDQLAEIKLEKQHQEMLLDVKDQARMIELDRETNRAAFIQKSQQADHAKRLRAEKEFQHAIGDVAVAGIGNFMSAFVQDAISGTLNFKKLLADMLESVGQMMMGLGAAALAADALALIPFLAPLVNAPGVGAGAAAAAFAAGATIFAIGAALGSGGGSPAPSSASARTGSIIPRASGDFGYGGTIPDFGRGGGGAPITYNYSVSYTGTVVNGNERQAARDLANLMRQNNALRFA